MTNMFQRLWRWLLQCSCRHDWDIETYSFKGHGVARMVCYFCKKEQIFTYEYEEPDDSEINNADD